MHSKNIIHNTSAVGEYVRPKQILRLQQSESFVCETVGVIHMDTEAVKYSIFIFKNIYFILKF